MVLTVIVGYLLGAIPVALIVARRYGIDLFKTADGNPGAWNALEQLGARRAWPAFVGDALKAFLAGMFGHWVGDWWTAYAGVAAAMVGHAFPVWTRFRGGKAVMAFVGGAFALSPLAAAICLALCVVISLLVAFTWGARVAVFAYPLVQLITDPVEHVAGTGGLMGLIGLLFLLRRRPARASAAAGAAPTT
jgi:glycerol-3-phosphate acyltransferase PlsY